MPIDVHALPLEALLLPPIHHLVPLTGEAGRELVAVLVVLGVGVAVLVGEVLLRVRLLVVTRHYYRLGNVGRDVQVLVALVDPPVLAQHAASRDLLLQA